MNFIFFFRLNDTFLFLKSRRLEVWGKVWAGLVPPEVSSFMDGRPLPVSSHGVPVCPDFPSVSGHQSC